MRQPLLKAGALVLLLSLAPLFQSAAQQNPFITTGDTQSSVADNAGAQTERTEFLSPFAESPLMQKMKGVQKNLQAKISGYITGYNTEKDSRVLLTFLLFSYAYGLIHVIGPGHRKIFLFSYFMSSKNKWKQGMAAGFMTAVLHAISAIFLIGGLYLITSRALLTRFNNLTPLIEGISYGIIVLLGFYLIILNIMYYRKGPRQGGNNLSPGTIVFVLASGLIPCPGAATIMIFSIAVQAPLIGIYSVLAMSLGMGTVLAFIPPAAILLQDRLKPVIGKWNPKTGERIHLSVSLAGAVMMVLLGFFFLI
ncbi:MAG: hypothetical protein JEZ04_06945 [Spirochaetales bacterium]|nr:hypothetical protein [Spirochaetales bacterium]